MKVMRCGVRFEIYPDFAGRFRWRLRADDGRIVADSAKSYLSEAAARMAAQQTKVVASEAEIERELWHGRWRRTPPADVSRTEQPSRSSS